MGNKTVLFTSTYLEGTDASGASRFERTCQWLKWHAKLKNFLGFEDVFFSDNGSDPKKIKALCDLASVFGLFVAVNYRETPRVGGNFQHDYPYCWDAVYEMWRAIGYWDKVIFLDNDGYLLSRRIAEYIGAIDSGWEAFWCKRHGFPESALHVMSGNEATNLYNFFGPDKEDFVKRNNGRVMELTLPFTKVNKDFLTDRFGESREPQNPEMDYYGQAPTDISRTFFFQNGEHLR